MPEKPEIGIQQGDRTLAVKEAERMLVSRRGFRGRVFTLGSRVLNYLFPQDATDRPMYVGGGIYYFYIPPH